MHARTIIYMYVCIYVCASTHMQAHTCPHTHAHTQNTQNIHVPSLLTAQYGSHDLKRDKDLQECHQCLLQ